MVDNAAHFVLKDNNTRMFLSRWPGTNGCPALWVEDANKALLLTSDQANNIGELAGYWEYAKTDCSPVPFEG